MKYRLRPAVATDAVGLCEVLTRSVREICAPDYDNDEELLEHWCSNKTPDNLTRWIEDPQNYFIVAEDEAGRLLGAGMIKRTGTLHICYIIPEALHRGVGSAMLRELVDFARSVGLQRIELGSTITAKRFYEKHGFKVTSEMLEPSPSNRVPQYGMQLDVGLRSAHEESGT